MYIMAVVYGVFFSCFGPSVKYIFFMEGVHMFKQYEMELAGRTLRVDIGRVCAQANGAALMHYGDTVVLSTATASKEPREGIDFFPLSVEYEVKMYAAGKIPGGFNKREGKASENAPKTMPTKMAGVFSTMARAVIRAESSRSDKASCWYQRKKK